MKKYHLKFVKGISKGEDFKIYIRKGDSFVPNPTPFSFEGDGCFENKYSVMLLLISVVTQENVLFIYMEEIYKYIKVEDILWKIIREFVAEERLEETKT